MTRLPFNADRAKGGRIPESENTAATGSTGKPWTVSQVSQRIRDVIAAQIPAKISVVGEISNFSGRAHWFFSLKDEHATLSCVCFASTAAKVRFNPGDGQEVVATGRLDYYSEQGRLQLYVEKLEPVGAGALELRFRALCEELRAAGYFEIERKKPIPAIAQRVAVVTSKAAAALQDVINTARQRWPGCELMHVDVPVQGDEAAPTIANAIEYLSVHGSELGIDVIILTRGGGSIEDLWAFNERIVADALFDCTLPVVAAIGHETDTTVAELVADLRCATPTQAAMTVVADRKTLQEQLDQLGHRMRLMVERYLQAAQQRMFSAKRHPVFARPEYMIDVQRQRIEHFYKHLRSVCLHRAADERHKVVDLHRSLATIEPKGQLNLARQKWIHASRELVHVMGRKITEMEDVRSGLERQLRMVSPTRVLERGFTMTVAEDGRLVRNLADVSYGDRIETVVRDGRITSEVILSKNGQNKLRKARKAKLNRKLNDNEQPGLFQ